MIRVSVPGKIHLLGEHSVVYGKPALLSSINLKVFATVIASVKRGNPVKQDSTQPVALNDVKKIKHLLECLETEIKKKFFIKNIPQYQIKINSEFPIGSGLGSSAAISVGLTKALLEFLKIRADHDIIFEIALEGEKIFHGNPSGGDVAAVLNEGLTWFEKKSGKEKIIKPLPFSISKKLQNFFLIDSGKPIETTKEMVEKVARLIFKSTSTRHPEELATRDLKIKYQKILDDQEELTKQLVEVLKIGDEIKVIQIIKAGERNLEKLGVVGKKAKKIIREIEKIGGAAKISGAGGIKNGSGMILAYLSNFSKIQALSKKNGWEVTKINLGKNE